MNDKIKLNLYAFITVFLWASAFPLTKVIEQQFTPNSLGLIRCGVAALLLIAMGLCTGIRKPFCKKDLLYFVASGGMGFTLYMVFFNTGLLTLTSASSSVIIAATPILTAMAAYKLYGEKIKALGWIAIAVAFIGVVILLFWNGILSVNIGLLWTLGAALVFCGYNILNRKLTALGYTSLEIVTYSVVSGTILLLIFLPQTVSQVASAGLVDIIVAIYLGIMPSAISYILWAKAISLAEKTSEVTNYMFITPLLSAIMGFFLLREVPDMGTFIGGAVIIAGVVIFSLKGK
ncbi:MAG: DMT family transporter [Bacillota bacterium]|nr:DMT family transporter [Bacillota bacterium]